MVTLSILSRWTGTKVLVMVLLSLCLCSEVRAQTNIRAISWNDALDQEEGWYASDEALRIADNILLYQFESGGWPKNINMARVLSEAEKARILARKKEEAATIDNGATYTQMRFLARVYEATGYERFRDSFLQGIDYLLAAQYENGGWPQYYPHREGYYEHITFNDNAMIGVMNLLRDVVRREEPFGFVDEYRRNRAAVAIEKGLEVILKTQVEIDGDLTVWCAQHDRFDFKPQRARTYELPSLSGYESVGIVQYLMGIEDPSPEIIRSIESAVQWFEAVKLTGIRVVREEDPSLPRGYDYVVISDSMAAPLWARFYELETNRPIFVGRDGVVHYSLSEIEHERRTGYRWLGDWPRDLLESDYPRWKERWRVN